MQRCEGDRSFTESCDLLMPNVGEIVGASSLSFGERSGSGDADVSPAGGSMRIFDLPELMAAFKRESMDAAP